MKPISKTELIITLVVIVTIIFLLVDHKKNIVSVLKPTTGNKTDDTGKLESWPSLALSSQTINDSNNNYTIKIVYPVTRDAQINDFFKNFAEDQITQFKKDIDWVNDPNIDSASKSSLSLDVNYKENKNKNADNYIFSIGSYTGGAHGLEVTHTINFDKNGIRLSVGDLFTNGMDGLKTIAPYVQGQLNKLAISDKDWIAEGAAPSVQNYQNFLVTEDGITFMFDPYQVAPYAAGAQQVDVPLSVFKNIANPKIFVQ